MELTGRSKDDVIVALHDCDNDSTRAINMLLEGENDQGEWQETGKRRKRNQPAVKSEQMNSTDKSDKPEKHKDREDSGPPRRGRQPPRMSQHKDDEWSDSGPPRKSGQPPRFARKYFCKVY